MLPAGEMRLADAVSLATVSMIEGHFCVSAHCPTETEERDSYEKLWLVVKALKREGLKGYRLAEGDVLKLGRLKFRVKELNRSSAGVGEKFNLNEMLIEDSEDEESGASEDQGNSYGLPCKVCLREQFDSENPLISPCNCGGTMKYIHLKCLQKSLKSKLTTRASEVAVSFAWKSLACDLCKKPFPYRIAMGQQIIELVDIPKPPGRYIILESLCKEKGAHKGLHVLSLYNSSVARIGRGNDCDLKLPDISVSRTHAVIKLVAGDFYLEDIGSKFGTMIQVKRPVAIESYSPLLLQTGRSLMSFAFKRPWTLFPACFRNAASPFDGLLGARSLFPVNTGIALSISDPQELLASAGLRPIRPQKYKENNNILFGHKKFGVNSSVEDDDEVVELEQVEVAELTVQSRGNETGFLARETMDVDAQQTLG